MKNSKINFQGYKLSNMQSPYQINIACHSLIDTISFFFSSILSAGVCLLLTGHTKQLLRPL